MEIGHAIEPHLLLVINKLPIICHKEQNIIKINLLINFKLFLKCLKINELILRGEKSTFYFTNRFSGLIVDLEAIW